MELIRDRPLGMEESDFSERRVIVGILMIWGLIFVRDILFNSIPLTVFTVYISAILVLCTSSERVVILSSLIPFSRGLPFSKILLFVLIYEFIVKRGKIKLDRDCLITILAIAVIEAADIVVFRNFSTNLVYIISYMLYISYVFANGCYKNVESKIVLAFSAGVIGAICFILVREILTLGLEQIIVYNLRFGHNIAQDVTVTYSNSNELALYAVVAFSLLLLLYQKRLRPLYALLAIIVYLLGFLSISRTYMLISSLVIATFIVTMPGKAKGRFLLIGGVVAILAAILLNYFSPHFFDWIRSFFYKRITGESSNGRIEIFIALLGATSASLWSLLFGYGINYPVYFENTIGNDAHNGLQELIICWGAIGAFICLKWVWSLIVSASENQKAQFADYMPMIAFLAFIQFLQWFSMYNYLLVMMVAIIAIRIAPCDKRPIEMEA